MNKNQKIALITAIVVASMGILGNLAQAILPGIISKPSGKVCFKKLDRWSENVDCVNRQKFIKVKAHGGRVVKSLTCPRTGDVLVMMIPAEPGEKTLDLWISKNTFIETGMAMSSSDLYAGPLLQGKHVTIICQKVYPTYIKRIIRYPDGRCFVYLIPRKGGLPKVMRIHCSIRC